MEEKITLGKFISQKRKAANLTQKELSDKLFVTESAVSKWERGISYPDITLISTICDALGVTEHELITASEDYSYRKTEKLAKSYQRFISGYKWIGATLYAAAIITCFICNLAISHSLSWFFIVLTSVMTAFSLTTLPAFITKSRALLTLGAFYLSLNLLLLTCAIYSGGNWFPVTFISILFSFSVLFMPFILKGIPLPKAFSNHKTLLCFAIDSILLLILLFISCLYSNSLSAFFADAVPSAIYCLIYPWLFMIILRYTKINGMFKTSACILMTGIFSYISIGVFRVISDSMPFWSLYSTSLSNWSQEYITGNILLIILLSCLVLSSAFAVGGIVISVNKNKITQSTDTGRL